MTDKPSLTTMFENATLVRFKGMRVKQIKRVSDNVLLYEDSYSIEQDIPVSIHWNHEYNSSSRPNSVSCILYADGEEVGYATLNAGNAWAYTFTNLRVYDDNNHKIEYTLDIPSIDRYEKTVSYTEGAGFGVLYEYQYGTLRIRNRFIYEDGTYGGEDPTSNFWNYSFTISGPDSRMPLTITYAQFMGDLYELDGLAPGTYSVSCTNAQDLADAVYAEVVSDSILSSTGIVEDDSTTTLSLFIHLASTTPDEPEEPDTIDIPITLTWDDNDNTDGNRPDQVIIHVYAGGEIIKNITLSADTNWTYTLEEYPKYNSNGNLIRYSLQADPVQWYTTTINDFDITETYLPETTSQLVRILWNDDNNSAGIRPSSVQATLKANGTAYLNPVSLSENNGWFVTYNNLPTNINKQTVTYTWEIPSIIGYEISSTQTNDTLTTFTLQKWERPDPQVPDSGGSLTLTLKEEASDSITIGLIATVDNEVYSRSLTATVYKNNEILTTISGTFDSSFEETITSTFNNGDIIYCEATNPKLGTMQSNSVTIQNISSDVTETMDISVSVVYNNDNNNQDGNRPTEIPIELMGETIVTRTATLTPENNWSYIFSDLEDGISYQLSASQIDFYDLDITKNNNDFIITADYLPSITSAIIKVSFDDVIPDYRPQSITATLNNGTEVSLSANNVWSADISNLPAVVNHETATYDWTIAQVPHYEIFQKTKSGNITRFILKQTDNIPKSIILEKTDGKQILSYIDRETLPTTEFCKLTATVTDENNNPLSNTHVDFYQDDGIWMSNISTNSNGQAVLEYLSEGVGSIEIYAQVADLTTDSYIIEDCYYYNGQTYQSTSSSSITLNKKIPSKCIISFENYVSSSNSYSNFITLGTNTTHRLGIGAINSGEKYRFFIQDDTSTPTIVDSNTSHPFNQWVEQTVIVNENTVNYYDLTRTLSNTDLTNLWNIITYNGGIRNIKVTPMINVIKKDDLEEENNGPEI